MLVVRLVKVLGYELVFKMISTAGENLVAEVINIDRQATAFDGRSTCNCSNGDS